MATNEDIEVLHEFEPLLRSTMREGLNILFVCVALFIIRIIFNLMTGTVFIRGFGHGIFFQPLALFQVPRS
jgi:hypothetical protein